jgi:hypothetical protein
VILSERYSIRLPCEIPAGHYEMTSRFLGVWEGSESRFVQGKDWRQHNRNVRKYNFSNMTLKVEIAAGEVSLRVRPRINWLILCSSFLVLFIIVGAGLLPGWERLNATVHSAGSVGAPIFGLLVISAMAVFNLYAIFKMVFFSEIVVLNQASLEIQKWLFAFKMSQRSFPNSTIENLRYDEWSRGRAGTQSGIRFESAGETLTFARQATHSDSWELIDKMLEVYKFPMQESTESSPAVSRW